MSLSFISTVFYFPECRVFVTLKIAGLACRKE